MNGLHRLWIWVIAILVMIGCGASSTSSSGDGRLTISAAVSQAVSASPSSPSAAVVRVAISVTGPRITTAITTDLAETGAKWESILGHIPAGADHVHGDAYDANDNVVFKGDADLAIGANSNLSLLLILQNVAPVVALANHAPIIDYVVASSTNVLEGTNVQLEVVAHDPDSGDTVSYDWTDQTATSFSTASSTTWTAPVVPAVDPYGGFEDVLTITVTDSKNATTSASVTIDISEPGAGCAGTGSAEITAKFNTAPAISAMTASPTVINVNETTNVSVTASDAENDTLTYDWSSSTCEGTFSDASAAPSFTLSALDASGACELVVKVSDGNGGTNTGTLEIYTGTGVVATFDPTVDDATQSEKAAQAGDTVTFTVDAEDPSGGTLDFIWSASDGVLGTPSSTATSSSVVWTAPSLTAPATITVTITTSEGGAVAGSFTIQPAYRFTGIATDVTRSMIESGGWTACYDTATASTPLSLAAIQSQCGTGQLLVACAPSGSNTFAVAANAPSADVFYATSANATHAANDVEWYDASGSDPSAFGFAPGGATIDLSTPTVDNADSSSSRMSWSTAGGSVSTVTRCGGLPSSGPYDAVIFATTN